MVVVAARGRCTGSGQRKDDRPHCIDCANSSGDEEGLSEWGVARLRHDQAFAGDMFLSKDRLTVV